MTHRPDRRDRTIERPSGPGGRPDAGAGLGPRAAGMAEPRAGRVWLAILALLLGAGAAPPRQPGVLPSAVPTGAGDDGAEKGQLGGDRLEQERRLAGLLQQGIRLHRQRKLPEAFACFEQALKGARQLHGDDDHPDVADSLSLLAVVHRARGELAEAARLLAEVLAMDRRLHGDADHPGVARSLNNLAGVQLDRGELGEAARLYAEALAMDRRLHRDADHPGVARGLSNLAAVHRARGEPAEAAEAARLLAEALRMYRRLHGDADHPDVADSLSLLAEVHHDRGELGEAARLYAEALAMYRRLHGDADHPGVARGLSNLAKVHHLRGELAEAARLLAEALAMYRRLHGDADHPDVARGLSNLAVVHRARGELAEAARLLAESLAMDRRLYGVADHPDVANTLSTLALVHHARGEAAEAARLLAEALAMYRRLHRDADHPGVAASLNDLGEVHRARGELGEAARLHAEALAMYRRLHGDADHPDVANSLGNLAAVHHDRGEPAEAARLLADALAMDRRLSENLFASSSEAQALNHEAQLPLTRDALISAARRLSGSGDLLYAPVWSGKAATGRLIERRQRALLQSSDEETRRLGTELFKVRHELARLLLAAGVPSAAMTERSKERSAYKEEIERQLARRLPEFGRQAALADRPASDLAARLPRGTVFIDFLRYVDFEQDPKRPGRDGERRTLRYIAFVLRPGRLPVFVDLGEAKAIEQAVEAWRAAIQDRKRSPAAADLRALVWAKIEPHLPVGTDTAWLAPDAALTRIPWAALPGRKPGSILLEVYALAVVPHGPFLLDRLTATRSTPEGPGRLLVVGAVDYDGVPAPVPATPHDQVLAHRSAERGDGNLRWLPLTGAKAEADRLVDLASGRNPIKLMGAEASTAAVLDALPRARWAHLATHGFFADPRFRSIYLTDPRQFALGVGGLGRDRALPGSRNPLVLSGLVLAGANRPVPRDAAGLPQGDGGILTAEAIAGLLLPDLELVVLSACETGLGEVAGGEGVFGLQRAFHLAGARDVVASLWKVDDEATAALMNLFYENLWSRSLPPLQALREAQLELYHHPEKIPALAASRGGIKEAKARVPIARPGSRTPPAEDEDQTHRWAAFVLSGMGR